MTSRTKHCARCLETKPVTEFPRNVNMVSGFDSWCHDCRREYARDYHSARRNGHANSSPYTYNIATALKHGEPLEYSRSVCEHVAWYMQRKIVEFEKTHGIEAPPHMTAILGIAKSMAAEHPIRRRAGQTTVRQTYEIVCVRCGNQFEARGPKAQYCDVCRIVHRKEASAEWRHSPAIRARRNLAKRQKREREKLARGPLMIDCQRCGIKIEAKSRKRKYCDQCGLIVQTEKARAWALANAAAVKESRRRSQAKWRENNPEYQKEYNRRWREKQKQERGVVFGS
jgi:hypothetical protein